MNLLTNIQIQDALIKLDGWTLQEGKLYRKLTFKDFIATFSFMTKVALYAEKLNHHPEWRNNYNTVEIWLVTHDENGITALDTQMAHHINSKLIHSNSSSTAIKHKTPDTDCVGGFVNKRGA